MKLIIFDIDDTITKSEYQHQSSFINTMKEFGISQINSNWSTYLHHTDSYILKSNYDQNIKGKFSFSFIENFENRMTELLLYFPQVTEVKGAKKIINSLSQNSDYGYCFATGSLLKPAILKLKQANISFEENLVVGSNKFYKRESILNEAIERAKKFYAVEEFEKIVSFGDGKWDLKAAKNIGVNFVGIGAKNKKDFKNVRLHINDWSGFETNILDEIFI